MAPNWNNWSRTARATPSRIETPTSTEALVDVVRRAVKAGERVHAVGGGLSSSAIAAAPGVMVDMRGLRGLRRIDREAGTATFGAGTRVAEAAALLEAEGLALVNPTSNTNVTLAGSAATGSQGSSLRLPSASSQLVEVELVTGNGDVMLVGERQNAELWPAVRLSLGALGIMSEVTVQTVSSHRVIVDETVGPFRATIDGALQRASSADYVSLRWLPHTNRVAVRTAVREVGAGFDDPEPGALAAGAARLREGLRVGFAKSFPALVPTLNRAVAAVHGGGRDVTGPIGSLAPEPAVPYATLSYAFPVERGRDMMFALRDLIDGYGFRVPYRVLMTFAPGDDAYLSNSYNRATATIGLAMPSAIDPRQYFHAAESVFLENGGLPHWGTYHTVRAAEFAHVMPRFGDFRQVRHRLDPDHRFGNAYLERVLGE